jgi:hypothetical protein
MTEDCKGNHEVIKVSQRFRRASSNLQKHPRGSREYPSCFAKNSHKSQWEARCRKGAGGFWRGF